MPLILGWLSSSPIPIPHVRDITPIYPRYINNFILDVVFLQQNILREVLRKYMHVESIFVVVVVVDKLVYIVFLYKLRPDKHSQ